MTRLAPKILNLRDSELLAAALRYRYLKFRPFCIKIILTGLQKSDSGAWR